MHKTGVFDKIISEEDADYTAGNIANVLGESEQIKHELCKLKTLQAVLKITKMKIRSYNCVH